MSNSSQPHGLQHARLPCPLPAPGTCSNPCSLSRWCHPTISFSVVTFSSCLQSFPASGSFPVSQPFASGGQNIGASASALVLPIQDWFPLGLTDFISLQSKGLSRVFSNTIVQKHQFFGPHLSSQSNSHIHTWPLEKPELWLDGPLSALLLLVEPQISSALEAASWLHSYRKAKSLKVSHCTANWPTGISGLIRLDRVLDRLTSYLFLKAGKWLIHWNYFLYHLPFRKQSRPSCLCPPTIHILTAVSQKSL